VFVSETSSNIGFAAGKFAPVDTDSLEPLTEMTAAVGGGTGGGGGVFGGFAVPPPAFEPPDDFPLLDEPDELGPDALNGSLLSKSENDCSWPMFAGAFTAEMSGDESVLELDGVAVGVPVPLSVGATGSADGVAVGVAVGAAVGVVVAPAAAGCGREPALLLLRPIIVCTAYPSASVSTTPRMITVFFCFSAFALAASATFFRAMVSPLLVA
jgi:hypothetical protein